MNQYPYNAPTQPTPAAAPVGRMNRIAQWFGSLPTPGKVGVGCGGLIVACVLVSLCAGILGAIGNGGHNSGNTGNTAQNATATTAQNATATATPKPAATTRPKAWVTVHEYTGSSNQQTPTFSLPDGSRIVWTYQPVDPTVNLFSCELDDSSTQLPIDLLVDNANQAGTSGTYNVHGDQTAYLNITADGLASYDIKVEVYQ